MSQALYRKYRSQRFAELVGQDSVTRILRNSIVRGRLGHAYLFCGPRGTGKTSVARIFAKALNCLNPNDGDACGECVVCTSVAQGSAVDVIEIDAASNRGIDDIRELRERVGYAPLELKYKVYIIDEVHMITIQGFNALLKTLEEPPGHVVFCLCTTEAHKLPITILSRCIRFDFRRLPQQALADHLVWMAGQEDFELEMPAALELAELAEGSARDSISLLDQLMVYCEKTITAADMQELFQLGDPRLAPQTVDMIAGADPQPLLGVWERIAAQGADAGQFLLKIADELKNRYLADTNPGWRWSLESVWEGINLLKYESFPAVLVELTLLNAQAAFATQPAPAGQPMMDQPRQAAPPVQRQQPQRQAPPPAQSPPHHAPASTQQPPQAAPPSRTEQAPPPRESAPPTREEPPATPPEQPEPVARPVEQPPREEHAAKPAPAPPVKLPEAGPEWDEFMETLREDRVTAYAILMNKAVGHCEDGMLTIEFQAGQKTAYMYAQNNETAKALVKIGEGIYGDGTGVRISLAGDQQSIKELKPRSATVARPADTPPPEVTSDYYEEAEPAPGAGTAVNPDRMERDAAAMTGEIGTGPADGDDTPATSQDFDNLFDPIELDG